MQLVYWTFTVQTIGYLYHHRLKETLLSISQAMDGTVFITWFLSKLFHPHFSADKLSAFRVCIIIQSCNMYGYILPWFLFADTCALGVLCCFALLFVWPCLLLSSFLLSSLIKTCIYYICSCLLHSGNSSIHYGYFLLFPTPHDPMHTRKAAKKFRMCGSITPTLVVRLSNSGSTHYTFECVAVSSAPLHLARMEPVHFLWAM